MLVPLSCDILEARTEGFAGDCRDARVHRHCDCSIECCAYEVGVRTRTNMSSPSQCWMQLLAVRSHGCEEPATASTALEVVVAPSPFTVERRQHLPDPRISECEVIETPLGLKYYPVVIPR